MKQSGGKKDIDGKMKRSVGSMRKTWERRWFTLVEGVDIDGDGIPDTCSTMKAKRPRSWGINL